MRRLLIAAALTALSLFAQVAQAQVIINCPSGFNNNTSGACSTKGFGNTGNQINLLNGSTLVGTSIELLDGGIHEGHNIWSSSLVNIQAFTTTFTFHNDCSVANPSYGCGEGWGFMGMANNASNPLFSAGQPNRYTGYATYEMSWSQGCAQTVGDNSGC